MKGYTLPFKLHNYQNESIGKAASINPVLLTHGVGLGKTVIATMIALFHAENNDVEQIVIIAPPVLLDQWHEFLTSIPEIPSVILYRGTPKERKAMKIEGAAVIIVSTNIFRGKADYGRFSRMSRISKWAIIWDELSLKSLKTRTIRKIKEIVYRRLRVKLEHNPHHYLIALNATPLSDLGQIYNWCTVFVPGVYFSLRIFQGAHVAKEDHWGKVLEWRNTQDMESNFNMFTVDAPDAVVELPDISYNVIPYTISKKHAALYRTVQSGEIASLPPEMGDLALRALFSSLQRLVLSPHDWGLDEKPIFFEWLDTYLDQIGDEQAIIFTRHISVSEEIIDYIGADRAVGIYGKVIGKNREESFRRIESGDAQILVGNMDSIGHGLNLQFIHRAVFAELPFRDDRMTQVVGRICRQGQKEKMFVDIPLAKGTIQEVIYYNLLKNTNDLRLIYKDKSALLHLLVSYSLTGKV